MGKNKVEKRGFDDKYNMLIGTRCRKTKKGKKKKRAMAGPRCAGKKKSHGTDSKRKKNEKEGKKKRGKGEKKKVASVKKETRG